MEDLRGAGERPAITRAGSPVWNKSSPFLKLPTVSSPAIFQGMAIFGDGLHTTDGAVLYSLDLRTGRALWRYEMDGKLIHMEGAPLVDPDFPGGPAVMIGAGDGGVLALSPDRAMLEGKEVKLPELRKIMDQRWEELTKQYEAQKKKDPDFAVPPSDENLPKAVPVKLWQNGENQWHVDAPLAMTADRVIVCSAYLDDDKSGDRAVICLDRKTGEMLWRRPVDINPWAGASIDGDTVIVGCSSVRFDKNLVVGARGAVVGLTLQSGAVKYLRPFPGGILSAPAISDGMAIFTATDGMVRAIDADRGGRPRWAFKAKDPFFAGVAVAGAGNQGVVYAADLGGVLHAISLADGKEIWSHDVGRDPIVQSPGMVFGSPMVKGQEVFLATCTIQGEHADQPCAVVSIADKDYDPSLDTRPKISIDRRRRRIDLPALVAPRKLPSLKDIYPLEVVCTWPTPAGQKAHETVVITEVKPSDVQRGLEALGLKAGQPSHGQAEPVGPEVRLFLVLTGPSGRERAIPLEKAIVDLRTGKPLPDLIWRFTGSATRQTDSANPDRAYGADLAGTFITIYPVTDETVIQGNLTMEDQSVLKLELNRNIVPEENTPVKLRIEVK
jgi:outer membrane protein assembly factor BamB